MYLYRILELGEMVKQLRAQNIEKESNLAALQSSMDRMVSSVEVESFTFNHLADTSIQRDLQMRTGATWLPEQKKRHINVSIIGINKDLNEKLSFVLCLVCLFWVDVMCLFFRSGSHVTPVAGLRWVDSYPFVCSVVLKNLHLKGYLALPLTPTPPAKRESRHPYPFMWTCKTEG